ncbi:MAG: DNA repair protein RecO [Candidatus Omnitrophica bacterium]|nr:DNA repair protein RecO [Candidatus Omnitrophota bacterium]MCM8798371.1 DNA repair protein RecO [Candidatus Omnitrophota bacterium]
MIEKAEALVLRRKEFRETSLLLTLFTREHGKINGLAKGVRLPLTRWGSNFPLFSHNLILFYPRRGISLVTEAELLDDFSERFAPFSRHLFASYLAELVDLILPLEDKNEPLFNLFLKVFFLLGEGKEPEQLVRIFEIKLLQLSGFSPRIDTCLRCQKEITRSAYFSHRRGGLLCLHCGSSDKYTSDLQPGTISTLRYILHAPGEEIFRRLRMGGVIKKELRTILSKFLSYHLETLPRSLLPIARH